VQFICDEKITTPRCIKICKMVEKAGYFFILILSILDLGCSRDKSLLYLEEVETLFIYIEETENPTTVLTTKLGVGIDSKQGKKKKVSVVVKDKIPASCLYFGPKVRRYKPGPFTAILLKFPSHLQFQTTLNF